MRRLVRVDPPSTRRVTRADRALTEMYEHLTWLREKRSPSGHAWHETDLAREVGLTEAMDILRKHGARLIEPDQNAPACPHGDPTCPCQDGDPCHYEDLPGSPAMTPPGDTDA